MPLVFSSAGFCTRPIKPHTSTPTRRHWPGSSTRIPPCHQPSARWSAPCALGRSCTSLTAGGTPRSTWTPVSSSPPSWARAGRGKDTSPSSQPGQELQLPPPSGKGNWYWDQLPEKVLVFTGLYPSPWIKAVLLKCVLLHPQSKPGPQGMAPIPKPGYPQKWLL